MHGMYTYMLGITSTHVRMDLYTEPFVSRLGVQVVLWMRAMEAVVSFGPRWTLY